MELGYRWTRTHATERAYEKCSFWLANIKKFWIKLKKLNSLNLLLVIFLCSGSWCESVVVCCKAFWGRGWSIEPTPPRHSRGKSGLTQCEASIEREQNNPGTALRVRISTEHSGSSKYWTPAALPGTLASVHISPAIIREKSCDCYTL